MSERSKYVYLTDVTLVRLKDASVEVKVGDATVYVPYSQIEESDLVKVSKAIKDSTMASDLTGHDIAVTRWWADKAGVDFEES